MPHKNPQKRREYYTNNREHILARQRKYSKIYRSKNKERVLKYNKLWRTQNKDKIHQYNTNPKGRYVIYKGGAKARGLAFEISYERFLEITNTPCYYCDDYGFGMDRVDSSLGYVEGNVLSSCSQCNYMKLDYTQKEFIDKCIEIADRHRVELSE